MHEQQTVRALRSLTRRARRRDALRPLRLHAAATDVHPGIPRIPHGIADAHAGKYPKTVTGSSLGFFADAALVAFSLGEEVQRASKAIAVSERNLQSAAVRLLPKHNKLV